MKRVLVTPLDWGLGHATRCIPVIRELQKQGCEVLIAGSGDALELLTLEFPGLPFFSLPGYTPHYPLNGSMVLAMARQLPRFTHTISSEHSAVDRIVDERSVDLIISDNRYGCWSRKVPSVLITHQSNVLMPKRFGLLQRPVRKITERLINRFYSVWIPDFPADSSLAGELISFGQINVKSDVDFIGWLSRFEARESSSPPTLDVLGILSGPEPQRTVFEDLLARQFRLSGLKFRMVRGLPSALRNPEKDSRFTNFLATRELQACIESSEVIIARSGFSTIMDLQALGAKVIFVPTPGQTEQEYLASALMQKGIAYSMRQDSFNLRTALAESKKYTGFTPAKKNCLLEEAIRKVLARY